MEASEKERAVKSTKTALDESKLTPPQREALAIAKAQGKDVSLTLRDLKGNMDPQAIDEVMAVVMDLRKHPGRPRSL